MALYAKDTSGYCPKLKKGHKIKVIYDNSTNLKQSFRKDDIECDYKRKYNCLTCECNIFLNNASEEL